MPILYLLLGHLIGDFVLQPLHLVDWKKRHITGVLVHSMIHLLIYLMVLFPYVQDNRVLLILFLLSAAHLLVDQIKVKTKGKHHTQYFILDQLTHIVLALIAGYMIWKINPIAIYDHYKNPWPAIILCVLIAVTYVRKIYFAEKDKE